MRPVVEQISLEAQELLAQGSATTGSSATIRMYKTCNGTNSYVYITSKTSLCSFYFVTRIRNAKHANRNNY